MKRVLKLAVGMVTFNRGVLLPHVLRYLARLRWRYGEKVIIVRDGGSSDDTWRVLLEHIPTLIENYDGVYVSRSLKPEPIPKSRNHILALARGLKCNLLLMLDDDVLVQDYVAEELYKYMGGEYAVLSARHITVYQNSPYNPYSVPHYYFLRDVERNPYLWMGCTMMNLDIIPSDFWFDETKVLHEDVDFCKRLAQGQTSDRKPRAVGLCNRVTVVHWRIRGMKHSIDYARELWGWTPKNATIGEARSSKLLLRCTRP